MSYRKILYGYQIQYGELAVVPREAETVRRIATLYLNGLSYQKISSVLNQEAIPFSVEAPLWNKHKVKRLLENPRYTGADGYPPIVDRDDFDTIQSMIQEKTSNCAKAEERPALRLKKYLRCGNCGGRLLGMGRHGQRRNSLYLRCERCDMPVTIPDDDLLNEVSRQMAEHGRPAVETYSPSADTIRLTNAINRGLERPVKPEETVSLILQGIAARYDCCPAPTESESINRPTEVNFRSFGQAVSHITITGENTIALHFN
jgi:DNA-directed RNA polymerase subunit RPC12/RpoP